MSKLGIFKLKNAISNTGFLLVGLFLLFFNLEIRAAAVCADLFVVNERKIYDLETNKYHLLASGNFIREKSKFIPKQCFGTCYLEGPFQAFNQQMLQRSEGALHLSRVHFHVNAWRTLFPQKLRDSYRIYEYDSILAERARNPELAKPIKINELPEAVARERIKKQTVITRSHQILNGGNILKPLVPTNNRALTRKYKLDKIWQVHSQVVPRKTKGDQKWEQNLIQRFSNAIENMLKLEKEAHRKERNKRAEGFIKIVEQNIRVLSNNHYVKSNKTIPPEFKMIYEKLKHDSLTGLEKLNLLKEFAAEVKGSKAKEYPEEILTWVQKLLEKIEASDTKREAEFLEKMEALVHEKIDKFERIANKYWAHRQKELGLKDADVYLALDFKQSSVEGQKSGVAIAKTILKYLRQSYSVSLSYKHFKAEGPKETDFHTVNETVFKNPSDPKVTNPIRNLSHQAQVTGVYLEANSNKPSYIEITGTWGQGYGHQGKYLIDVRDLPTVVNQINAMKALDAY